MPKLDQELAYLATLRRFEKIKLRLTVMENLLAALGNPERHYAAIHIAGTNGKGSTAAFIASILQERGYRTGLNTSPYLLEFNERIKINNHNVTDEQLISLINTIRTTTQKHHLEPTYFEFATTLAFLYFAQQNIDIAVVEVGMGGLLDATNVLKPLISVITNIGHDHQAWLGHTTQEIAQRKAGIIKPATPLITAETDPAIRTYFKQVCAEQDTQLYHVQEYLKPRSVKKTLSYQTFSTQGIINGTFTIPLIGEHQITNACTALLTIEILDRQSSLTSFSQKSSRRNGKNRSSSLEATQRGLAATSWPGRLQFISHKPHILLDCAHNPEGLTTLINFLDQLDTSRPDVLVVGIKSDKDPAMLNALAARFRHVIATESHFEPLPAKKLAGAINHTNVEAIPNYQQAYQTSQNYLKPNSLLVVTGSIYLVGNILKHIKTTPH